MTDTLDLIRTVLIGKLPMRREWTWSPLTGSTDWISLRKALDSGDEEQVKAANEYLDWYASKHKRRSPEL